MIVDGAILTHAPPLKDTGFLTYCEGLMIKRPLIANQDNAIDCPDCIRKLQKYPQMANYLKMNHGIVVDASEIGWSFGGKEEN